MNEIDYEVYLPEDVIRDLLDREVSRTPDLD